MLGMALALDYNLPLLGQFNPTHPRSVLFIGGGDSPDWDYGALSLKLMRGYSIAPERRAMCGIAVLPYEGFKLTDVASQEWLSEWINLNHPDVIMIDTLLSVHRGDENDNGQMNAVMAVLKALRDKHKITIVFGHHTAKPSQGNAGTGNYAARGASAISAACDFHFQLSKRGDRVKVLAAKGRGAAMEEPVTYFDISRDLTDEGPSIKLLAPTDKKELLLLAALKSGPKSRKELSLVLRPLFPDATEPQLYNAVANNLVMMKARRLVKSPSRGVWSLW
jgi:hypothetical protein